MSNSFTVGISDLKVVRAPDVLVTYALGSCVGICLYDPMNRIGGMAHIMLPSSQETGMKGDGYKFADTGIALLVKKMEQTGARSPLMSAKIAGGAQMFASITNSTIANIGQRNVSAVKNILAQMKIPIVAEDTGSNYGRTLYFYAEDGRMKIKSAQRGEWIW
ncbi:MAG TPA: chemotaxis protein CheD [Peptococcaceae bacterium]|nr:chemotaxis protein CheD [Peptococcaceae bacterium]